MAKVTKQLRVLYFINGPVPSDEDKVAALELAGEGFDVVYRNGSLVSDGEAVESFDDVAGDVPPAYERAKAMKIAAKHDNKFVPLPDDAPMPPVAPGKQSAAAKAEARQAAKAEEQRRATEAAESARAALSGGPATVPAGGWGQQPNPGGPAPAWTPNA